MTDYDPAINYITAAEAAVILDVHPATVRHAVQGGHLRAIKHFGRVLLDPADVEAYKVRTRPDGVKPTHRPPRPPEAK